MAHEKAPKSPKISPWKLGGLSLKDLAKAVYKQLNDDDGLDTAAALGYFFLLALFPMIIFLVSLLALVDSTGLAQTLLRSVGQTMPPDAYSLLSKTVYSVIANSKGGLLTFGAVGTLWAASSGITSLIDGLNSAYEVKETRSFVKRRLIAIGLTFALSVLTILGAVILVASDKLALLLANTTGIAALKVAGTIGGVVIGLAFIFAGLELCFFFGPNVKRQKWSWISPGSLVGVFIFIATSLAFSEYLRFSNTYDATYGSIGAVIILMLWLYNLGLAIVLGGETNSEIAKAALAEGSTEAPLVGVEEEAPSTKAGATSGSSKASERDSKKSTKDYTPYRKPANYTPQYFHDDADYSKQAKRRIAMRRIRREEEAIEHRNRPTDLWGVLRRPIISLVYLGSIGVFLYEKLAKEEGETRGTR